MSDQTKPVLSERDIPEKWYNIIADMPNKPLPPLHLATHDEPSSGSAGTALPMELISRR